MGPLQAEHPGEGGHGEPGRYEIGVASAKVYDFLWDTYCDWYIELTKTRLQGEDEGAKLRPRMCSALC